jgi:HEAT repeat protein
MLVEQEDFMLRRFLIRGVGEIGGDLAALGLLDHYRRLTGTEERKQHEIDYTIKSLGVVDNDLSYTLLGDLINDDEERIDRRRLVEALGQHSRRTDAVPLFMSLAGNDRSMSVRNKAAQALKFTADPSSAPDLEQLLETETNKYVRQTMMGALGDIGDPSSLSTLERVAKTDQNVDTRVSALDAIFKIGGPKAREILEEVAEKDKDAKVKEFAHRYIGKLDKKGN